MGKEVHTYPKCVCPKVNVIVWLEYELAYYDSAVHRCNHVHHVWPPLQCLCVCLTAYICINIRICLCLSVPIYENLFIYADRHTYLRVFLFLSVYVHMYGYDRTLTYTLKNKHVYIYIYIYIYIYSEFVELIRQSITSYIRMTIPNFSFYHVQL